MNSPSPVLSHLNALQIDTEDVKSMSKIYETMQQRETLDAHFLKSEHFGEKKCLSDFTLTLSSIIIVFMCSFDGFVGN